MDVAPRMSYRDVMERLAEWLIKRDVQGVPME